MVTIHMCYGDICDNQECKCKHSSKKMEICCCDCVSRDTCTKLGVICIHLQGKDTCVNMQQYTKDIEEEE